MIVGQEKPDLDELVHYGIPGMKWGVRNTKRSVTSKVNALEKVGKGTIGTAKIVGKGAKGAGKLTVRAVKKGEQTSTNTATRMLGVSEKIRGKQVDAISSQVVRQAKLATITPRLAFKTGKKVTSLMLEKLGSTKLAQLEMFSGKRDYAYDPKTDKWTKAGAP